MGGTGGGCPAGSALGGAGGDPAGGQRIDVSMGSAFQKADAEIYAQFESAYADGSVSLEPSENNGSVTWVNARDIAGAQYHEDLSEDEFWSHHGNTKSDYAELASHIPDVKEQLDKGIPLEQIKQDPALSATASQYFDTRNAVKVYQYKDKYIFGSDGRHRVAIAQEYGYDIPVRVTHIVR